MNALEKAIYDYHNTNKTIALILQETGISKSMFYRNLDYKEEFRVKKKARKYTFNFDKFKQDTADKFYWLGFLGADGCVVGNTLSIELKENDVEHLEKFNAFCENTKPITKRINNLNVACVKTQINSYELIDYLKQMNRDTEVIHPHSDFSKKFFFFLFPKIIKLRLGNLKNWNIGKRVTC